MVDAALLPALLSLLTVARSGSVGAAARLHHRTSSAISQQIRKLERHLGVTFLERAGRGVRLTAAGEAALPGILKLGTETEALFAHLAELSGRPPATLRVAVSDYLGKALAGAGAARAAGGARAAALRDRHHPLARGHPPGGARRGGLRGGHRPGDPSRARSRAALRPALRLGRPRRAGKRVPLPDRLRREPLLRLGAGSQGRRLLEDYLARERIQPTSTIDVPSVSLLLAYVSGGLGVGLAPALALAELDRGRVRWERAAVPSLPVTLVHRPGFRRGAAAGRFAARLIAEAGQGAAEGAERT